MLASCSKQNEWLDEKYRRRDIIPDKLEHYQQLLDFATRMNYYYPILVTISADNVWVPDNDLPLLQVPDRNALMWAKDIYQGGQFNFDWSDTYGKVMITNVALEGAASIPVTPQNTAMHDNIRGSALFFRSFLFHLLLHGYSMPYSDNAAQTPGIPLRTTADISVKSVRSTVKDGYDRMVADLKEAESLLPDFAINKFRPSKQTVYILLAKVYMDMGDYANARSAITKAYNIYHTLVDYNTLTISGTRAFLSAGQGGFDEVIFYAYGSSSRVLRPNSSGRADSALYSWYSENDIRRQAFFNPESDTYRPVIRSHYSGTTAPFCGFATNEMYYIMAELEARDNNVAKAMELLNTVLEKRWKTGTFTPLTATDKNDAIKKIMLEKRKELPFTGQVRWEDLRRLNKEPQFAVTLTRKLNGQVYTLPPGDPKYALPIPDLEIQLTGMEQNPR